MLPFRVQRAAQRELLEATHWYKQESLELARDFGSQYRAQVIRARRLPESGHLVTDLPSEIDFEVRRFLFDRFPYAVIVACLPGEIAVIAVAHQHRRPDTGHVVSRRCARKRLSTDAGRALRPGRAPASFPNRAYVPPGSSRPRVSSILAGDPSLAAIA